MSYIPYRPIQRVFILRNSWLFEIIRERIVNCIEQSISLILDGVVVRIHIPGWKTISYTHYLYFILPIINDGPEVLIEGFVCHDIHRFILKIVYSN